MKKLLVLLLFITTLMSCGQSQNEGRIIEMQEVSPGKFVVKDERDSGAAESWVVCYYLNGSQKTIGLSQAEQLMNQAPPSPANSPVFVNYDGGHNQGGISFSDLMLYHMMFNGFGGSHYHTQVINRYPIYNTTIQRTVNVNYSTRYNQRWSKASFYRSQQNIYANRRSYSKVRVNTSASGGTSNSGNYKPSPNRNDNKIYVRRSYQASQPSYSPPKSSSSFRSSSSSNSSFRSSGRSSSSSFSSFGRRRR